MTAITLARRGPLTCVSSMSPGAADRLAYRRPYAPHYSLPNKSDRSRRTLYLVLQRASTGGPDRAEYNRMKRAYNPPVGKIVDLQGLRTPNGIFYRE